MFMTKRSLCILGSTGSIGTQSLDIIHQTDFRVGALAAAGNIDLLEQQVRRFQPDFAAVEDEQKAAELKLRLADTPTKVLSGREGILELSAMGWDMVLNAVVGIAGLLPTMNALQAGSDIALANKETLVTGGRLVMNTARQLGRTILPVD
ncbi:MAG: 1-deoxy-D-xylulose-5-phosphate reductoisomerase, partial [Clostridia bacterium]|nr:1-deoxy-D-xylulose-5-phosphate reductoisomerase [Clostridia bacterium]